MKLVYDINLFFQLLSERIKKNGVAFNSTYAIFLVITLYNDLSFFDFSYTQQDSYIKVSGNPHSVLFYLSIKLTWMFIVYYGSSKFMLLITQTKIDEDKRRLFGFIMLLFIVYSLVIVLAFPGLWRTGKYDELKLFEFAKHLQVQYHQGFLMALFYIMACMIYPAPVMVVICQAFLGSVVLGHILDDAYKRYRKWQFVFLLVLFVFPSTLYYMLYPLRTFLTAVFLAALFYKLINLISEKKMGRKDVIEIVFYAAIVSNFRLEMRVFIFFVPLIIFFMLTHKSVMERLGVACIVLGVLTISVLFIGGWNRLGNQGNSVAHNMLSFTAPLADILVKHPGELSEDELSTLNIFFDVEKMIYEHRDSLKYSNSKYERITKRNQKYDLNEYKKAQRIVLKMIVLHPFDYVRNKARLAYHTVGLTSDKKNYYKFPKDIESDEVRPYFYQLNPKLAKFVKKILAADFWVGGIYAYQILFPLWIPFFVMSFSLCPYCLASRNIEYAYLQCMLLSVFAIVVLTAPADWSMYYFPGYFSAWITIILFSPKKRKRINAIIES